MNIPSPKDQIKSLKESILVMRSRGRATDYLEDRLNQALNRSKSSTDGVDIFVLGKEINVPYVSPRELEQMHVFGYVVDDNPLVDKQALRATTAYQYSRSKGHYIGF